MSDSTRAFEKSGRLTLKSALVGGVLGGLGALAAWWIVGNLIR
jgi:hypothetical protein